MKLNKFPNILWRKATIDDFDSIYLILRDAAKRMVDLGRKQWDENYPQKEDVLHDLFLSQAYVLEHDSCVLAYGVVSFDGEPAYDALCGGTWLSNDSYAVVHRLAVSLDERKHGLGILFFEMVEQLCHEMHVFSIKVDTNFDNVEMLQLLSRLHFELCGKVYYEREGEQIERLAFEKLLSTNHLYDDKR